VVSRYASFELRGRCFPLAIEAKGVPLNSKAAHSVVLEYSGTYYVAVGFAKQYALQMTNTEQDGNPRRSFFRYYNCSSLTTMSVKK